MEYLSKCPLCQSAELGIYLRTDDHFLSKQSFTVTECNQCKFRFTNPRPSSEDLPTYYESKEYISHSNEKKGLMNLLYQKVRKYTISKKYELIGRWKQNGSLLDIGCGTGEFLKYGKDKGWETFGIEPGENARRYATEQYQLDVQPETALSSFSQASFDVITMWHVLEHVPQLNERITTIRRLLKDDGLLVVAVPNCNSLDARIYGEFWAAWDLPRHLYHFNRNTLTELLSRSGFHLIDTRPMKFDAFYVSLLSEKYMNGKMNYLNAFMTGFKSNLSAGRGKKDYSSLIFLFKKA